MRDEELTAALYARDPQAVIKQLKHAAPEQMRDLLVKTKSELDWLAQLVEILDICAPWCACGEIATEQEETACEKHASALSRFEELYALWEGEPTEKNAQDLMTAAYIAGIENSVGRCYFPPCGSETDMDYEQHYIYCDEHEEMLRHVKTLVSLRKARGDHPSRRHDRYNKIQWIGV